MLESSEAEPPDGVQEIHDEKQNPSFPAIPRPEAGNPPCWTSTSLPVLARPAKHGAVVRGVASQPRLFHIHATAVGVAAQA